MLWRMHIGKGGGSDGRSVKLLKAQMHRAHDLRGMVHKAYNRNDGNNNSNYNNIDGNNSTASTMRSSMASIIDVALGSLTARPTPASSILSLPRLSGFYHISLPRYLPASSVLY